MSNHKITPEKRRPGRPLRSSVDAAHSIQVAALNVFAKNGFEGTSIMEIAKAAQVAKPLIHYHFESKEALWQAAVTMAHAALMNDMLLVQNQLAAQSPLKSIEIIAKKLIVFAASHPQFARIVVDETGKGGLRAEWLYEKFLIPSYLMSQAILNKISKELKLGAKAPKAEHVVPVVLGIMNFPFIEAEIIRRAYGKDVYAKAYMERQGQILFRVLQAFFKPE